MNSNDYQAGSGKVVKTDGSVVNEADGFNTDGSQNIQIAKRKQTTIQTHNAVSVALSSFSNGDNIWHDADGYDKLACTLLTDLSSLNSSVSVIWSNDGSGTQGVESVIAGGTGQQRVGITDIKARYFKIQVFNNDSTAAHTMSAWAYLKD